MRILYFLSLSLFFLSANAENIKVSYIDTEKVINNLTHYEKNLEIISKEFEPKKKDLLDLFNHIELLRTKINSNQQSLDKETLKIEQNKLYSLEESFKNESELWHAAVNNRKIELLQKIEIYINQILNEYAANEEFDLILYENVAYASEKVDITENILTELEKFLP